jgi:glycosyltransferase involved in cell wall biosynthesis
LLVPAAYRLSSHATGTCSGCESFYAIGALNGCPPGAWEILVVNPQSPDGTSEHLAAVARSYPHVRIRKIAVSAALATNKGAMINRALDLVRGDWIWLTDADRLFSTDASATVLRRVEGQYRHLFYGCRKHLSRIPDRCAPRRAMISNRWPLTGTRIRSIGRLGATLRFSTDPHSNGCATARISTISPKVTKHSLPPAAEQA